MEELASESVVRNFRTTAADGKKYLVSHYNLDMIIALGYRVLTIIATRFRQWATERLKEYIVKGFTIDDERLKKLGGGSYCKARAVFLTNRRWSMLQQSTASISNVRLAMPSEITYYPLSR